jgi:hypothetical protein
MKSPTRFKKSELVEMLTKMGHTADELAGMKRPELLAMYMEEQAGQEAEGGLDEGATEAEAPDTEPVVSGDAPEADPTPDSPEWTQWVLGHFTDDELDNGNPRVDGLRRVAQKILGPITEEGCDLVAPPNADNMMRACVKGWVVFQCFDGVTRRYESLADASPDNIAGQQYSIFLTAMADTRSKGRCYRNALQLRRIVAAEELVASGAESSTYSQDAIHTGQITAISMITARLKIAPSKYLTAKGHEAAVQNGTVNLKILTHEQAVAILQDLQEMQTSKTVPEEIKV